MAKKVIGQIKLHIPAGKATPAPPVGPALGQQGVNIMDFCKAFNARTQKANGILTPVVITVYQDHSYSFITKTPPASVLLAKAAGVPKGSGEPEPGEGRQGHAGPGGRDRQDQDGQTSTPQPSRRRCRSSRAAARSMGIEVVDWVPVCGAGEIECMPKHGKKFTECQDPRSSSDCTGLAEALQQSARRSVRQVRRDAGGQHAAGRQSATRRPDGSRHGGAAPRHGQDKRVLVIAAGEKVKEAEEAGADFVGGPEMVKKIQEGWLDFDAVIATPDMMREVGKLGKVLGPRGLMPNPKTGTVTFDVANAVKEIKAGKVEFRVDKTAIIHVPVGKLSFEDDQAGGEHAGAGTGSDAGQAGGRQGQVRSTRFTWPRPWDPALPSIPQSSKRRSAEVSRETRGKSRRR